MYLILYGQCSAKALEKWGQMTHTTEKYGDIVNFWGVSYVILPFMKLKLVGTWAPTAKTIGDIPDFNVLNVPKMQPKHNPVWGQWLGTIQLHIIIGGHFWVMAAILVRQ